MHRSTPCLLARVQTLIDRTYGREGLPEASQFVIGDEGLTRLYGVEPADARPMLLVRCVADVHRVRVYYPDALIENLEAHDPGRGLSEKNLHDFSAFVEELDHLLVVASRVRAGQTVTAMELELHANVTKVLVLSLFLARTLGTERLSGEQRARLRWELLERGDFASEEPELRTRYLDARRHAIRFLDRLERTPAPDRPRLLRAFSEASVERKLAQCA